MTLFQDMVEPFGYWAFLAEETPVGLEGDGHLQVLSLGCGQAPLQVLSTAESH